MIILLLIMTISGFGHCLDQLPTQQEIQSSINRTISEVERLMKVNTTLPQLSRSQIVDILYNITSKEVESLEESVEQARSDYQRALMVVLPYNSRDAKNEDIKDLFTKPPIIQMIPDTETMLPFASIQAEHSPTEGIIDNFINVKYSSEINDELSSLEDDSNNHKIHLSDGEFDTKPEKFSFVLGKLENLKSAISLQDHPANISNNQYNRTIEIKPTLDVFHREVVPDKPTETIIEITLNPIEDIQPTVPTTKTTNILTFDQWKYFAPPATSSTSTAKKPTIKTTTKQSTSTIKLVKPLEVVNKPQPFISTLFSRNSDDIVLLTPSPSIKLMDETSSEKPAFSNFDMRDSEMMNDEPTGQIFVTPMPTDISQEDSAVLPSLTTFISIRSAHQDAMNKSQESVSQKHEETLLESLGIDAKKNKLFIEPEKINLTTYNELTALNSRAPENKNNPSNSLSKFIPTSTEFDHSPMNLKEGLSNLTPDVRLLFQRFGLQSSDKNESIEILASTTTKNPIQSIVKNSWSNFKPLPRSQVRDEGMRSFLAQFGLGVDNRREKSIRHDDSFRSQSIIEFVPGGMKSILENIGLIVKPREITKELSSRIDTKKLHNNVLSNTRFLNNNVNNSNLNKSTNNKRRSDDIKNNSITLPSTLNQVSSNHVFKPHEIHISDQKQKEKINELLDTVKLVQEGKAQVSDVRRVANNLLETAKTLQGGPDPLSLEEIMKIYHDDVKNEVKRQNKAGADEDNTNGFLTSSVTLTNVTTLASSVNNTFSSTNTSNTIDQGFNLNLTDSGSVGADTDANTKVVGTETTTIISSLSTEDTNLNDLADSFGGSTAEPDPALPTPRKSGLYFLLDWNSFLEVGEEGKDRVNLRLAPKVGDKSRFIPVVIP